MASKKVVSKQSGALVPQEIIEKKIFVIRGKKVMLDRDLAEMYGVAVKVLNQAVKRNGRRFPDDFMFRLTKGEMDSLRSQNVTLDAGRGKHPKYFYHAFTEHGILMLSSVLNSDHAVDVNIGIMRVFVRLKEIIGSHKELADKLEKLEKRIDQKDEEVHAIFEAIRELMQPPPTKRKPKIGFR